MGDYLVDAVGRLRRRQGGRTAPCIHAGIQILHPRLFEGAPEGPFSLNRLYDKAQEDGRLWGLRHDGEWYHVGTAPELSGVEAAFPHLAGRADESLGGQQGVCTRRYRWAP